MTFDRDELHILLWSLEDHRDKLEAEWGWFKNNGEEVSLIKWGIQDTKALINKVQKTIDNLG
jgi:hypothetical protein